MALNIIHEASAGHQTGGAADLGSVLEAVVHDADALADSGGRTDRRGPTVGLTSDRKQLLTGCGATNQPVCS